VPSSLLVVEEGDELTVEGTLGGGRLSGLVYVALQVVVAQLIARKCYSDAEVGNTSTKYASNLAVLKHPTAVDVLGALERGGDAAARLEGPRLRPGGGRGGCGRRCGGCGSGGCR